MIDADPSETIHNGWKSIKGDFTAFRLGCRVPLLVPSVYSCVGALARLAYAFCRRQQPRGLAARRVLLVPAGVGETMQREIAYQIEHLQAYLRAHGLGTSLRSTLANTGMTSAILHGRADEASCWATNENCLKACAKPAPIIYDKECKKSCENENMPIQKPLFRRTSPPAITALSDAGYHLPRLEPRLLPS